MERGFTCQFVETPSELECYIQIKCEVCYCIIREPHQVTCCGKSFCYSCIREIKNSNKPCPSCNKEFSDNPDKRLKRTLYALKVYCSHQKDGCKWTGELGQLDAHLNEDPEPGKELEGCQHENITCLLCGDEVQRQSISTHQRNICTKRPFSCEHCHNYESNYDDVIHNHWPVCGSFPLPCPNECGLELPRQKMDSHFDECPMTIIDCDFIGCTVKFPRKDMQQHLTENLPDHISHLAHISHSLISAETKDYSREPCNFEVLGFCDIKQTIVEQQEKIKDLTRKYSELRVSTNRESRKLQKLKRVATAPMTAPVLTMTNFEDHKKTGDTWYSVPVYTHHQGYKICLSVHASGHSTEKGTYISVYLHFLKGEFDDYLPWPFCGIISFQLLDQVTGENPITESIKYNDSVPTDARIRVRDIAPGSGWGSSMFLSHDKASTSYIHNDTLHFQIYKCEIETELCTP